ncbi:MAG: sulfatase [Candidatus Hydrogenedentota bacterium]
MHKRLWRLVLASVCLAVLIPGCTAEEKPEPPSRQTASTPAALPENAGRPNVVFLLLDTLRADRVHGRRNGHAIMPGLAALAEESWEFKNCVSQATWTKPAMTTIFTSLYPQVHRVQFGLQRRMLEEQAMVVDVVPEEFTLFSEWLQEAGYATGAVQRNSHMKAAYGFAQGFDEYLYQAGADAEHLTDEALAMAQRLEAPYFLYVHYMDVHGPYEVAEPYFSQFGEAPPLTPEEQAWFDNPDLRRDQAIDGFKFFAGLSDTREYPPLSDNVRHHIMQRYDSECRYLDLHIERLIASIVEKHPNTIFIVMADHGEEFWEHGWFGHGTTVYHEVAHVPFILQAPGKSPRAIDTLVRCIDLAPTLAELLGIAPLAQWQGRSLVPIAHGADTTEAPALTNTRSSLPELGIDKAAYTTGHEKLIIHRDDERMELFDLAADPTEQENRAPTQTEAVARYRAAFTSFLENALAHPAANVPTERMLLDDETREQLEALGYFGGIDDD